ncbi:MAG: glycosyltransferase family 39 protein, partial [Candidatus Hydrogenedentes bacterium]|nr:glycosyltransferase family 39 protein [Candidatus Hydrogenedentota bacterium]
MAQTGDLELPEDSPAARFRLTRGRAALLLCALCLAHLAANVLWLYLDNHVIRIDEGFHVRGAQAYFDVLTSPFYASTAERLADLPAIFSPYPPALHLLGASLALVFGYTPDVVALSGSISLILVILGTYALGRRLLDREYALLCAALVSLAPLVFAASRYMALENLVAALVIWAIYLLLRTRGFTSVGWTLAFAFVNGVAILTKQNAFGYYLIPAAAAYAWGLGTCLRREPALRVDTGRLGRILLNGVLTVLVSAGIFLPWYYHHLPGLEEYWLHEHKGGTTPFAFIEQEPVAKTPQLDGAPVTPAAPGVPPDEPAPAGPSGAKRGGAMESAAPEEHPEQLVADLGEVFQERPWRRYFINFVNNGVFLPYLALSILGALVMVGRRRYWGHPLWLLLFWFFGSYFVMTLLFRHITPRYALPFIAPLGFAAAAALYSLPRGRLRGGAIAVVLGLLTLQFLHVSFGPVLRPARLWLPVMADSRTVQTYLDEGLALYKDEVVAGTYTFKAPYRDVNYVDRIFEKMRGNEEAAHTPSGTEIPYQSVWRQRNFGGLQLAERRYWPEPNPLMRPDLAGENIAKYRFSNIQIGMSPAELMREIGDTRYVTVFLAQSPATTTDGPHHRFYEDIVAARPMYLLDYFAVPAYGKLPGAYVGLLATKDFSPDMRPLNLFEMYDQ